MVDIPEDLLRRSAEAKAKALGLPVEQVLAEMKGEAPPSTPSQGEDAPEAPKPQPGAAAEAEMAAEEQSGGPSGDQPSGEADAAPDDGAGGEPAAGEAGPDAPATGEATSEAPAAETAEAAVGTITEDDDTSTEETTDEPVPPETPETGEEPSTDGHDTNGHSDGNGRVAAMVSPRPVAEPTGLPEGVRTQRLLTVVKARAIQQVKAEPSDKVNTWPHLMVAEFGALLAMTAFLVVLSVILAAPLLEPANFNATPNPSKAPWYFLGLQELLSYFDPQIAGVTVPTIIGIVGFMMIPYVDRNPSTKPSDRRFAIMLYTMFLTGSATLTIIGVLFRAQGFNFAFPWEAGVFFDDLRDWVDFGLH